MGKANLHPNPLSGWSEDYPDPEDDHAEMRDDPSKSGIFRSHNCWRCSDGEKPCVNGAPNRCAYPYARND